MRYSLIICLSLLINHLASAQSDFYAKRWSDVYRNEVKDLPKSALKIVDTIYYKAKKEKNITEITKSLLYQSKFALTLEENAELIVVKKLKKEIGVSNGVLKNVLESILAQFYWRYFQANRQTYYKRTTVSETANTDDFRTWDASAMLNEIDLHFKRSIANTPLLKATRLETFDDILALAEHSKRYRPTLYDFLTNYAIDFYATDEIGLSDETSENAPDISQYFSRIDTIDLTQPGKAGKYTALMLFKELLAFHKQKQDTNAYVNLEIERLKFIREHTGDRNEFKLFKNSLTHLKNRYYHHPASALINLELALLIFEESPTKEQSSVASQKYKKLAIEQCNEAITRFPGSDGAIRCQSLKDHILAKQLALKAEAFIPTWKPSRMLVYYTNLPKLHINIYEITDEFENTFNRAVTDSARTALLSSLPLKHTWLEKLPQTDDYETHRTEYTIPSLPKGTYLVVATENPSSANPGILAYTDVRVTDIALIEVSAAKQRFQVVDRHNGTPLAGVNVRIRSTESNDNKPVQEAYYTTDKNGFIELKNGISNNFKVTVYHAGDVVTFSPYYHYYYGNRSYDGEDEDDDVYAHAYLFTDRSLYRPGQTVFFKGILIQTKKEKSTLVTGEYVEVYLTDPNGKDVSALRLKTNAFGSFSGEFKLPNTGLTGEYNLYADEDSESDSKFYENLDDFEDGEIEISVEEYKRPTFEVTIKPVKGTYNLNDTIRVTGNATAYSGSKIAKAHVTYTVQRTVNYPRWYYWLSERMFTLEDEIADGEVMTNEKGEFMIPFKAIPEMKSSPDDKPIFVYTITVNVTDINGETRSAESQVKVGYQSMVATIHAPTQVDLQQPSNGFSVSTENLNGQFLVATGTIKIYKLLAPATPVRTRPWPAPDYPTMKRDEFEKTFPHDSYGDDTSDPKKWTKGKLASEISFNTKESRELTFTLDKTWDIGAYVIELNTNDSLGRPVHDRLLFNVIDSKGKRIPDNKLLILETEKNNYHPGDLVKIKAGSAFTDAHITVEIEKNHKIVKTYTLAPEGNTKELSIPTIDATEGGFAIHAYAVMFNTFVEEHRTINVQPKQPKFTIETETFTDKLQPGSKTTWSFTIHGEDDEQVQAEVVASMYDASLDQFKKHAWSFDPTPAQDYTSWYNIRHRNSFGISNFVVRNLQSIDLQVPQQNYDRLDWFGLSLTAAEEAKRKYLQRLYFDKNAAHNGSTVTTRHDRKLRVGYISGRITSTEDGTPLPGVTVSVKGAYSGTVTDINGHYSIEAGKNDILVFSFIGLKSVEAEIGRKNIVDVAMQQDLMQLSEVVVVGYGTEVKKELLGSISVVSYADEEGGGNNGELVFSALQGRVSGVQISNAKGLYSIAIRGMSSLGNTDNPLYVIDGVIVEGSSSVIDQDDISNISVLKDSDATALYGSRGANGVIIITTKSGQKKLDSELAKVNVRKNFNETAFFYPHLTTTSGGRIRFSFTSPESLTRWKLQLLAHTKRLVHTTRTLQAVTQKEMMITPNLPRFLRAGDEVIVSAKVANLSNRKLDGKIALLLTDPVTGASVDQRFDNVVRNQTFTTTSKGNTQVSWRIKIPGGIGAIQYKIVAKAGSFSDGEQNILPILENRMLVTETMPVYVRAGQTKTFNLTKLQSQSSSTLKYHQLTFEFTSNPAWYAIQSLPYLIEYPYECAEQTFSRFYANSIASHVVTSNPKIKKVFDKWAGSGELVSNLEKNHALRTLLIEETPWVRDAENETEQKKRVALLFDLNTMSTQLQSAVDKLKAMQHSSGGFSWFAGSSYTNTYITQHIVSSFGHLKKLGVNSQADMTAMMNRAVSYCDETATAYCDRLLAMARKSTTTSAANEKQQAIERYLSAQTPGNFEIQYLYMRSFYADVAMTLNTREAFNYLLKQSADKWLEYNLYQKGMIALIQYRSGNKKLAWNIIRSLAENATVSDELGMYWKTNTGGWYWYQAPIETHALLIEAFAEVQADDPKLSAAEKQRNIDDLRVWLIKNRQTNAWPTTKATTEAVYALLMHGVDWLSLESSVNITMGNTPIVIDTTNSEAGTGYFKTSWKGEDITPSMGTVTLTKKDNGVSWGGLYWQYFEDLDKITPAETPLKLNKKVYKVVNTDKGEQLNAITTETLKPGDLVRIRIELTVDRDMEFLHMKDMRAAGFEPVDVLSHYKWREGLGYYQSTRDAATNFFFDEVPKGTYVFEYDLRVSVRGNFSNGITTIQSMYAPEFSSHSEGIRVVVE